MPRFSTTSKRKLEKAHPDLQKLANRAIHIIDFGVVETYRSVGEQQRLYAQGRTLPGPIVTKLDGIRRKSKHNHAPAMAMDLCPWKPGEGFVWNDRESFSVMGGVFLGLAHETGIWIRWGGNWNQDGYFREKGDNWDLPHIELMQ